MEAIDSSVATPRYRLLRRSHRERRKISLGLRCSWVGKHTLFASTKLPLRTWFLAIYLVTASKGGIAASELQRQLGFRSYETAWSWLHKIRRALVAHVKRIIRPHHDLLNAHQIHEIR